MSAIVHGLPQLTPDQLRWGAALVLPLAMAFLLPVKAAASPRTWRWLSVAQVVGALLVVVGPILSLVLFPVLLLLMFCMILSGLLWILSFFTSGFPCPQLPSIDVGASLLQLGVALLLFATGRKWRCSTWEPKDPSR